jgi:putative tryptophan/tyrosine transport system substrate-binding protein
VSPNHTRKLPCAATLLAGLLLPPLAAPATPAAPPAADDAARTYRVALVLPRPEEAFEQAFEEYFAKRDAAVRATVLYYSGRAAEQPGLIARLRQLSPDLVCTWGTSATLAVAGPVGGDPRRYVQDIPVVFTAVSDPIAVGLVSDLARPGRNVTGVSPLAPLPAQIDAIRAYRPLHALGYLYVGEGRHPLAVRDQLRRLAAAQHFELIALPIPEDEDGEPDLAAIPEQVRALKERGADVLYIDPDTWLGGALQGDLAQTALAAGLPVFAALESTVRRSGALFGLVSPPSSIGRFAAAKARRILEEHKAPAAEPIEALKHFSLLINMRTAARLRVFPPLLLLDAAEVTDGEPPHGS